MPQRLRVFVSSPTDVPGERLRADLIIDKLSLDYSRFFVIESYRWEHEAMLASRHFQDAIEPPSAFDIVVLILWSRLGTPLPERTAEREYRGIDQRAPVTGTEWEYEEALKVARETGAPDLLAFRNMSPAPIDTSDREAQARSIAQLDALNAFWTRHFADRGVFLAAYDEYRTLEEFARRLEESLRRLIERRIKSLATGESREPIWLGDPFRGLQAYEFEHAPIFFGRDAAVMKATEQLAADARSSRAFLLVSGASGSGKSSLAKAGIMPRLMKPQRISGTAFLRRAVFRPGSEGTNVFLGLAQALTRVGDDVDIGLPELIAEGQDAVQLATHLRGSEPGYLFANALGRLTQGGRQTGRLLAFEDAKLILVIDQLEELFTVAGITRQDRRLFIQLLACLARSGAVWVIATLRADFWHRAMEIPELIELTEGQGRIDIAAPSGAELAEMIRKPAQAAGLSFEAHPQSGLGLDAVLAEHAAAAPGALPLLSFTLYELYRNAKARGEAVLSHASYEALGGLEGAITNRADEIAGGLPPAAQMTLPRVLRGLATVTGPADLAPIARSVPLESFGEESPARVLVDAFVAARLLVAANERGALPTVRLAHEALISRWQRARDQLAADRRDLETRAIVEREFGRWSQARGRARRLLLLHNPDLANAIDLSKRWGEELNARIRDFILRSARRTRLVQQLTIAAAAVFAIVAGGAVYLWSEAEKAKADLALQTSQLNVAADGYRSQIDAERDRLAGELDRAKEEAESAKNIFTSLVDAAPNVLVWQRDLAASYALLGDASSVGDRKTALENYRRGGEIFDGIVKLRGNNTAWRRALTVVYNKIGDILTDEADYNAALESYQHGLAVLYEAVGSNDLLVGTTLDKVAVIYRAQARYSEAELLFNRSLAIREIAFGSDHPDVANSLNNLAELFVLEARYSEAEPLVSRALEIREKTLGPDHPDVARSLTSLTKLYRFQRRYAAAEALNSRSLYIFEKSLGPNHPEVGLSLNNLALLYYDEGRYADAEPLFKRALVIYEKGLGPDHPDVAMALDNLAELYREQGRYADAEPLHERALAILEKALGPDHPNVAQSLNNLAELYREQGRYAEAEPLVRQSLAIRQKALGPDHPDVAQ